MENGSGIMEVGINNELFYQKIHDLERALSTAESMKDIMQQEIDTLQLQLNNHEITFQNYKKKNEAELSNKWLQKISLLQSELDDERETSAKVISNLKEEISALEKQQSQKVHSSVDEDMKEKLYKQLEENIILREQLEEMKLLLEISNQEKTESDLKLKNLEERYEETSEILEGKKEALRQATEALKDIQEEKALMANEIASLKAEPIDDKKRGNSLFAEVDDNRKVLMKNIALLKNKLAETKIKLSSKTGEIVKLRTDNDRLHHKIQEIDRVIKPEQLKLIETYKSRIQELELLVCKLEVKEVEPKIISSENQRLSWLYNSLEKARNEVRIFQQEYNKLSKKRLDEAEELLASAQEIRSLKVQLSSLKINCEQKTQEICGINSKIEIQGDELIELEKENTEPNSIKISKGVRFSEDVK